MPIYEYECQACAYRFEEWQKISDSPIDTCPKCQHKKVEKLISQTSFQLKGGGWYSDLYASSKGGANSNGSSSEGKSTTPTTAAPSAAPSSGGADKSSSTTKSSGASTPTSS